MVLIPSGGGSNRYFRKLESTQSVVQKILAEVIGYGFLVTETILVSSVDGKLAH